MKKRIAALLVFVMMCTLFTSMGGEVNVKAADTKSDLVAEWKFDGNVTESVNGLETVFNGKKENYVDGVFGKAMKFNGKDDYLEVTHNEVLNLGNSIAENPEDKFTISFWVNLHDITTDYQTVLDKGGNVGWGLDDDCYWSDPYEVSFMHSQIRYKFYNDFEGYGHKYSGEADETGASIECEGWDLITITYDGKNVKVYHDDILRKTFAYDDGIFMNEQSLFIGAELEYDEYRNFLKGDLDNLRIYKRALSYGDVDALYQEGIAANKQAVDPDKKLVAYYPFDGNLKDQSDFKNDAEQIAVGGVTKYANGINGKAVTISKGNYIEIPAADQLNFEYEFTASMWVKTQEEESNRPLICRMNPSYGSTDDQNEYAYKITISPWNEYKNCDYRLCMEGHNPDSWTHYESVYYEICARQSENDEDFMANEWNHIAYTYKYDPEEGEGMLQGYLNGELISKTDEIEYPDILNASGSLLIGYDNDSFFTGSFDEFKLWNKCLTQTEIKKEYDRVDAIALSSGNRKAIKSIKVGKTLSLAKIIKTDADTNKTTKIKLSNIKFESSNPKIFTVSKKGVIKGIKKGSATLKVTYGYLVKTYTVTVK